ncbi:MAG: PLP-dependent aminotransferase family protein, partial [Euryarchaeota archaeon]|nr:PLP-dependent aminotransferase family protein [Euryarchaeota archaeon]
MEYDRFYSEGARKQQASEIRELLKLTQRSDIVSFAGGLPNPLTFPVEEIRETVDRVLHGDSELALQYGPTEGYTPLREEIARYLNKDGFELTTDNVIVTNGSQQGLDLIGRTFLDRGTKVIVGSPTYLGALSAFSAYKCDFVPIQSDFEGLRMDSLEETLERLRADGTPARLVYTVPTFQNPSGTVL